MSRAAARGLARGFAARGGVGGRRLVGPAMLAGAGGSFARASAATLWDAAGALAEAGVGVPRFGGAARRLAIEGQATNQCPNPRLEGAAAGTPGTPPASFLTFLNNGTGLSRQIVGVGTEDGIPFVEVRVSGTAPSNTFPSVAPVPASNSIVAAQGQVWAFGILARLVAGSLAGVTATMVLGQRDAGNTTYLGYVTATPAITGAPLRSQRLAVMGTLNQAGVGYVHPYLQFTVGSGQTVDFTLRVGLPQVERNLLSSVVLPAAGAPAATTRAADALAWPLAGLGLGTGRRGTLRGRFVVPQQAPAAFPLALFQVDDGSGNDNNRLFARVTVGGTSLQALVTSGGVNGPNTAGRTVPIGGAFTAECAWDADAGRLALRLDGGAVAAAAGQAFPASFATLRVGNTATLGAPLSGDVEWLEVLPVRLF